MSGLVACGVMSGGALGIGQAAADPGKHTPGPGRVSSPSSQQRNSDHAGGREQGGRHHERPGKDSDSRGERPGPRSEGGDGKPSKSPGRHHHDSDGPGRDPDKPRGDRDDSKPPCPGDGHGGNGNGSGGGSNNGGSGGNNGGGSSSGSGGISGGGGGGGTTPPTVKVPTVKVPNIPDMPRLGVTTSGLAAQSGAGGDVAIDARLASGGGGSGTSATGAVDAIELQRESFTVDVPGTLGQADAGIRGTVPRAVADLPATGSSPVLAEPAAGPIGDPLWPPTNFRVGYSPFLRSADINQVAFLAVPGVAGLIALTAMGGYLGYRQAKSGLAVRAAGTARFLS
jgi:hypothetical protein